MKIFSICIVQNNDDVIDDVLRYHQPLFDHLYVWDIGSIDSTPLILSQICNEFDNMTLISEERIFSDDLRAELFWRYRNLYGESDWCYQLDSDEFLKSDVKSILKLANFFGFDYVRTNHFNFQYTKQDYHNKVVYHDLRSFELNYSEVRAFRNREDLRWTVGDRTILPLGLIVPENLGWKVFPIFIDIYHYAFRSPEQIMNRFESKRELIQGATYKEVEGIDYSKYDRSYDVSEVFKDQSNFKKLTKQNLKWYSLMSTRFTIKYSFVVRPFLSQIIKKLFK